MSNSFDVLIIGAGPAGSSAAIALARRGYEVLLIDKQPFPREKICGDFINPIGWPLFENLGVEERILGEPHHEVRGFRITTCSGAAAETTFASSIGLGLRRALLDQVLVERAVAAGASVRLGTRVVDLTRIEQSWRVTLAGEEILRARLIIGADGRNSWVAQRVGLSAASSTQGRCVGFQTRLRAVGFAQDRIEIHLFPGGYAGLVALGDGTLNLGLAIARSRLPRSGVAKFLFAEWLPQNPYLKALLQNSEWAGETRSAYPVFFLARQCYADGVLLAGDAARVTEPISGEGVYWAMRSGLLAAETFDRASQAGALSTNNLRRYEHARTRALRSRLVLNSLLRRAIYRLALVEPLIRLSKKNGRALTTLVNQICQPQPAD